VAKSFLSAEALSRRIEVAYGLAEVRCQLMAAFMRDVYRVTSKQGRRILYVYRHRHRTVDMIRSEWQIIETLHANGVPVCPAVFKKDGGLVMTFQAPEGTRCGVLTGFADGEHLRARPGIESVSAFARSIARIHNLFDSMPEHELLRPVNDLDFLLDQSVEAFETELPERKEDIEYLNSCASMLRPRIESLPVDKPFYGLIHGDVIRANAQVAEDGSVTVLDFDLCGMGWRAYDIATYLTVISGLPEEREARKAFLDGYQQAREITRLEWESLPLFEALRSIFSIGVPAKNIYHWGREYLDGFLGYSLERLKRKMELLS
jgi:Ser/Thr protein kinase RdoA (MazF antagonist)